MNGATFGRVNVLGVRVDAVTERQYLDLVAQWVEDGTPRQVVTINPEFVMRAQVDPDFAAVLARADLATPDGVGIIWAARRQGVYLRERVGGTDSAMPMARQCARLGHRLFLLGAAEGVAERAALALQRQFPDLVIAGTFAGSPSPEMEEQIVALIRAARPHILWVAYGSPAQDMWIARNKGRLGVPVSIGVGGAIDYLAGVQRRAPAWLRRLWLDWAFRLVTQPWRWRRMLAIPRFIWAVLRSG
ncbi:MAG TPA: WecB/TagA/CpsF family glycosyltransferase [Chloroflexota bacterium]|nr:WecB/TagA/CpsF family glycosyltransferase [Chloroflexota bacterium]